MSATAGDTSSSISSAVLRSFKDRGLNKTIHLIFRNLVVAYFENRLKRFDRIHGIETSANIPLGELTVESANKELCNGYYRTPFFVLRSFFSVLPDDKSDFVFVDIGAGKGPILFFASGYNFKKIIGVEFARELCEVCIENIKKFRSKNQLCRDIECVEVDVTEFDFPNENLAIFMFDPFQREIMLKLMKNLEAHFNKYKKKIFIAYYAPRYSEVLSEQSFLKQISPESPLLYLSAYPVWPMGVFETTDASDA